MDNVMGRLERGDLNLDHVKAFGIGRQDTPTGGKVSHACPVCPLAHPAAGCAVCAGHGSISEEQLFRYQRTLSVVPAL